MLHGFLAIAEIASPIVSTGRGIEDGTGGTAGGGVWADSVDKIFISIGLE
jgi:hypothetical protein